MVRVQVRGVNRIRKSLASGATVELHYVRGAKGSPAFWRSDSDVPLGSAEYLRAYQSAGQEPRGDDFGSIITAYLGSRAFRGLGDRTRKDYLRMADLIRDRFGSAPVAAFESPKIRPVALAWREGIASDRVAQYAWTVLRLIVGWAYDNGKVGQHHLRGGGSVYETDRSGIIWTEAEIVEFEASAPPYVSRLLRALAETGMRPGDLIGLAPNHIEDTAAGRRIVVRTNKRNRMASIPVSPAMARLIDETPASPGPILRNSRGLVWTEEAASKAVLRERRRAGLRDALRWYDARGSAVTRLVAMGVDVPTVALIMGWSTKTAAEMVDTYAYLDPAMTDAVVVRLANISANRPANRVAGRADDAS